jgi:hypothetical protein
VPLGRFKMPAYQFVEPTVQYDRGGFLLAVEITFWVEANDGSGRQGLESSLVGGEGNFSVVERRKHAIGSGPVVVTYNPAGELGAARR